MRLFSPRKTTMLFVIRDKTRVDSLLFSISFFLHCRYPTANWYKHCLLMILAADAVGKFRACVKRRYSEGIREVTFG